MDLSYDLTGDAPLQIGLIVLQQDETIERDMRRLMPQEVELLVSRVPSGSDVTPGSLSQMQSVLSAAASLLPDAAACRAVGYGCTSGTAEIGAARIAALIREGTDTDHVSEPLSALLAACRALGVRRLGMVSPYIKSVSDKLRAVLAEEGVSVERLASFNEAGEARVARIAAHSITQAAVLVADGCDAIFLSCTNLRTLEVIAPLEATLGKPVLSSNLVLAWHLLHSCQIPPRPDVPGVLWAPASQ